MILPVAIGFDLHLAKYDRFTVSEASAVLWFSSLILLTRLVQVRFVQADAIRKQLNGGHIVLLGNLAYSAAGEVLNCDCYSVATQAAIDLHADKLFCMTTPSLQPYDLPHWLPISGAEQLLTSLLQAKKEGQHNGEVPEQASGGLAQDALPVCGNACKACIEGLATWAQSHR